MYALTLKVTEALHQDYLVTLALLERLEALFKKYPAKKTPPADAADVSAVLNDAVRVLEEEVGRHFAFEEEHLFPRFTEFAGPGIPMMLGDEHEAIRGLAGTLIDLARSASEGGFTADAWAGFHRLGSQLIEREVFHVQKEEMGFLPALDQTLDGDADATLLAALKAGRIES